MPKTENRKSSLGFTLAELLLALLILGNIATFTIPKVLNAQQNGQKKAIFKETIATLSQVGYLGYLKGEIRSGYNGSYLLNNINALKICRTAANAQGCFNQAGSEGNNEQTEPGVVLHNGAVAVGLNDAGGGAVRNGVLVDWNGNSPPNISGEDQIMMEFCFAQGCPDNQRPGTLEAAVWAGSSTTLFRSLFQ